MDLLPAGLDAVYDRILSEIHLNGPSIINRMLEWILVATRPLRVPELCEAVDIMPTDFLSREDVSLDLIESCGHLLQISKAQSLLYCDEDVCYGDDFWSLSVTFLHQSAKDYLIKKISAAKNEEEDASLRSLHESVADQLTRYFSIIGWRPEMVLSEICKLTVDYPLATYAGSSWHLHLQEVENIREIFIQNEPFLGEVSESREVYGSLFKGYEDERFQYWDGDSIIPLLHLASISDLQNVVEWCLKDEKQTDINLQWGSGRQTPLQYAIVEKNERIVNTLLDANADILATDSDDRSAFVFAMEGSSMHILRRMSQQNECKQWITQEAQNPQTNLWREAIAVKDAEVCRFLVEELKLDVNLPRDNEPIYTALQKGQFKLARTFVTEWHAHFDNFRALEAICHCNRGLEESLLGLLKECPIIVIHLNTKHPKGHNVCVPALQACHSPESKLHTLIEAGCNPNCPDYEGRTPLHNCAMHRHLPMRPQPFDQLLALLLSQKGAQVNRRCDKG